MRHLTIRVAWHDTGWDARICAGPSRNPYCVALQRVREERNDRREDALAGRALDARTDSQVGAAGRIRTVRHRLRRVPTLAALSNMDCESRWRSGTKESAFLPLLLRRSPVKMARRLPPPAVHPAGRGGSA